MPAAGWSQAPDAGANDEAQMATEQIDESQALVERIREVDGELVELIQKVSAAEGEELELVRTQIGQLAEQQRDNLAELTKLIASSDADGAGIALLEQQGEQLLRRSSRRLRNYIQLFQGALENEADKRSNLAPSEAQIFEHHMAEDSARLDSYYTGLIQLTDQMASLGLNVDAEAAFLETALAERGHKLLQLLELTKKRLEEQRDLLKKSPEDGDLQAQVFAVEERYQSNKTSLMSTIHMMKARGLDYVDLEVQTIEITGEITPEALKVDVAVGFLERAATRARAFLVASGPSFLLRALMIAGILLLFWLLARMVRRVTTKVIARSKISTSQLLQDMVVKLTGRIVLLLGVIYALSQLGISLGPILAGLGIAGFILGFALQETLANFAAGAMILAYRPFDIDDMVETAGIMGKVRDMNLVSTRILTPDFQTLIVPNSKIWGDVIRNVTAQPSRRVDMVFGISYEDEIEKAERVLAEIVAAHDKVLPEPETVIKLHALNDSSVDFIVRPWAKTDDYWDVYWDITRAVKLRFDQEGISIPYPQRDVHLTTPSEIDSTGEKSAE
jgi:small conductance mechanosensitive channel